jgi:ferredoxin
MIINIRSEKCTGCGVCITSLTGNLEYDHQNKAMVVQKWVEPELGQVVQQLEENCQGGAIEIS